jgi:flagellar P-ring protein precursor FlgI
MRAKTITALILLLALCAWSAPAGAVRIKDMASIRGVRGNQLIGYGLVVGLNGTGDKSSTTFTTQGLANMLTRMGVRVTPDQLKVKNVAAVMVTADLPAYARNGGRIDVTLSSLGDASSLAGGTLLITPLKALDGQTYAVAQGPVSVGGFSAGGEASSVSKNHPTVGRVPRGGNVERELPRQFAQESALTINLDVPDFTNVSRMAAAINRALPELHALALDPSTVKIELPQHGATDPVSLMAKLEGLEVSPDISAKVIIDERTGTVVMGEGVRISTVAVASGALSIAITETPQVSQALPFAQGGRTVVTPRTNVEVGEQKKSLAVLNNGASIGEVVKALNALGATPRDLIVIMQAIKAAVALQADLEIL